MSRTIGWYVRLTNATAGHSNPQRRDALRVAQAQLDRDPSAHRVAHHVRAVDVQRVHRRQHGVGEPARRVGRGRGLGRRAEAGQVEGMDAVALRERCGGVEKRALRAAEAVQQQHVGAGAHRQRGDPPAAQVHVVDAQQRPAPVLEAEEPLERDREVEVAACIQQPLAECLDARQLAAAQVDPRRRVGADDDVGGTARRTLAHAGAVRGAAHLPGMADVAQHDAPGRVEARVRAEVAVRE